LNIDPVYNADDSYDEDRRPRINPYAL
jgi:hypothetical protein